MANADAPSQQIVQSYGVGLFRISATTYTSSVIVLPGRTLPWAVTQLGEVDEESLQPVLVMAAQLDILILGTGNRMHLADSELMDACRACAVALEVMDTGAACRTFNLLAGEQRRVAAALIALT